MLVSLPRPEFFFCPDGTIDLADFGCLAASWMDIGCGECGGADFDGDNNVDVYDLEKLAGNWLK